MSTRSGLRHRTVVTLIRTNRPRLSLRPSLHVPVRLALRARSRSAIVNAFGMGAPGRPGVVTTGQGKAEVMNALRGQSPNTAKRFSATFILRTLVNTFLL